MLATIARWLRSPLLLAIRAYWGWSLFRTGLGKLGNLDGTATFFASLNIPFPKLNALVASCIECGGGALLVLGLATRITTVPIMFVMLIAYITNDSEAWHSFFRDPDKFTSATPFLFLYAVVILFVFGPGKISLDAFFFRKELDK